MNPDSPLTRRAAGVGPVTDILEAGPPDAASPARSWPAAALRRAGLPVSGLGLCLAAVVSAGHSGAPAGPSASLGQPTSARSPGVGPRLVVPDQAHPGEQLTVLAYRDRRLCGPAQLHLDGGAVPHAVIRDLGPIGTEWTALIMTIDVPRSTTLGRHVIQLYGPKAGGRGPICAEVPEHQGRVAEAAVSIG